MAITYSASQLQYDPRTKQQIKEALYSFLYAPAQKQFKTQLDTLIIRNTILGGYSHKSFSFKGELYTCDTTPAPRKMNRLVTQLVPAMTEYLEEIKHLNDNELPYVIGYINQVLNSSHALQDYFRLLPAAVHRPIEKFSAACPCKQKVLSEDEVIALQHRSQHAINLMKQRMVRNLLI